MKRLVLASLFLLVSCATSHDQPPPESAKDAADITAVLRRDFHEHGPAKMDRVEQTPLQRLCNETGDQPSAEQARRAEAAMLKTIPYPAGGFLGDWKRGEKIAQSGRGMTWNDKPGVPAGGSCYNCHELSPKETSFGTVGPSLRGFGKTRGYGADMQRYVYGKIYNSKAYNACSIMPRFGDSGTLTEEQIKDLVALLLDPGSPVNQ